VYQLRNIILLAVTTAVLLGCKSSKKLQASGFENELFAIANVSGCTEGHSGDVVDSQVGKIVCKEAVLSYDYGRYGPKGPMTAVETFDQSFKNYHYSKFFELTHIDKKLYKVFTDSVSVIAVQPAADITEKTLYECSTCNAVATIDFLGKRWYYPTTVHADMLANPAKLDTATRDNYAIKVYTTETGQQAATLTPVPMTRSSDYLSITITDSQLSEEKQRKLLRSISLKPYKQSN